jgi:hypothetical protein
MYAIVRFGTVQLPERMPTDDLSTGHVESTLRASIGATYDLYGALPTQPRRQEIVAKGIYLGETGYWVDAADQPEDAGSAGAGDYLIFGNKAQMIQAQLDAIKGKVGQRDQLWRERSNDRALHWKQARLLQVRHLQGQERAGYISEIECTFESAQGGAWRAETAVKHSYALAATGYEYALVVPVDSEYTIDDAVITITRGSGSLVSVVIRCFELGIDLTWVGLATSSGALIIDCGAQTMRHSNGSDIYQYFAFGNTHTARGWCPLPPGDHLFYMTVAGGTATVDISYYPQSA